MNWIKRGNEYSVKDVVLKNLGLSSEQELKAWLTTDYRVSGVSKNSDTVSLDEICDYIRNFKDKRVTIIGDYDVDGVTSTAILETALKAAGFTNVCHRIPHRFSEGYGINATIIDEIPDGLVITCDNGIAGHAAIQKAKDKGLSVVVTDHHEPVIIDDDILLPPADYIIDPKAVPGSCDFNEYCGAGIAYKISMNLLKELPDIDDYELSLGNLASLGTVCDVVELREENWAIVHRGLQYLTDPNYISAGLSALIRLLNLPSHISASDIGYKIGPCINAASRMNDTGAEEALSAILCNDPCMAVNLAEKLIQYNESRKQACKESMDHARMLAEESLKKGENPLVLYIPNIGHGIIGLIAGRLCEEYSVPAIVFTDDKNGVLKGSARSDYGYNIKEELDKAKNQILHYGGHKGAAGLSVQDNIDSLKKVLIHNFNRSGYIPPRTDARYYDLEISVTDINDTIDELNKYAPYGMGNPEPVIMVKNFSTIPKNGAFKRLIGNDQNHVKIWSSSLTGIGFDMAERMENMNKATVLSLIGHLSRNYYNGSIENQIEFFDYKETKKEPALTALAQSLEMLSKNRSA